MSWLLETVYEYTLLEKILANLLIFILVPYSASHFYTWLYWKTNKEFFKKINFLSSAEEIDAYCKHQDQEKEKRSNKRGRD